MKVKIESYRAAVTNRYDDSRSYTIDGAVNTANGSAVVESGTVYTNEGASVAYFSEVSDDQLSVTYSVKKNRADVLAAVEAFVNAAKQCVASNSI